jgi:hypothetical protein
MMVGEIAARLSEFADPTCHMIHFRIAWLEVATESVTRLNLVNAAFRTITADAGGGSTLVDWSERSWRSHELRKQRVVFAAD